MELRWGLGLQDAKGSEGNKKLAEEQINEGKAERHTERQRSSGKGNRKIKERTTKEVSKASCKRQVHGAVEEQASYSNQEDALLFFLLPRCKM